MAGSDNFAPMAMSGLPESPPPFAHERVSSARLAVDDFSLEKLLEAAWVLQCLHDQLHNPPVVCDKTAVEPEEFQLTANAETSSMTVGQNPAADVPPIITSVESNLEKPTQFVIEELVDEITETPRIVESCVVESDVPAKLESKTVELKHGPLFEKTISAITEDTSFPLPKVVPKIDGESKQSAPPSRPQIADLIANHLQTAVKRTRSTIPNLLPAVRVNLTWRAIRATAIATPILLLAVVGGFLLLGTWHHEPLSTQSLSTPSAPATEPVSSPSSATQTEIVPSIAPTPTTATSVARPGMAAAPNASHRQVTDPAALSAVQGLSQYEVVALRRQAKYGDASAAFALGMAYELGRPVPQSCAKAAHWVAIAAEAGNSAAEYNLGLRYRDGDGVRANRALSEKWLRKAAARRYANAKLALKLLASH